MKRIFFALIIATFLFSCKSEENNNNDNITPVNNDTAVVEKTKIIVDTTTIFLTEVEANLKSDVLVKKSEEINNKLDELLENL